MRAAGIAAFGDPVRLLELPEPPSPAAGEVLLAVKAAGVGNWDEITRTGGWDVGRAPPWALGVEAAGRVLAVGPGVEWSVGAAVMTHPLPLRHQGCWAERLIAPAQALAEKPDDMPWSAAGAFRVPALTAEQVVATALDVQPGETLFVNGAGGVTGGLIVELAARRGARVIATSAVRSAARVTARSAAVVLDYHDPDWPARARDAAGRFGVQAAANAARTAEPRTLRAVADGGRLATITGAPPASERGIRVTDVYIRPDGPQLRRLAAEGLHLDVPASYALTDAADALAHVTGAGGGRAVVLEPRGHDRRPGERLAVPHEDRNVTAWTS